MERISRMYTVGVLKSLGYTNTMREDLGGILRGP